MIKISKANPQNAQQLAKLAKESFLPAHGHSASKEDINKYISKNFTTENFKKELSNSNFHYYLIYYNNQLAGYSKIIFDTPNDNINIKNVTKMERLYLLKEFYEFSLGKSLFNFNIELAKKNNQKGIWLAVWVENNRAIVFYKKMNFKIVGSYDFKISETHYNPNHILFLEF